MFVSVNVRMHIVLVYIKYISNTSTVRIKLKPPVQDFILEIHLQQQAFQNANFFSGLTHEIFMRPIYKSVTGELSHN